VYPAEQEPVAVNPVLCSGHCFWLAATQVAVAVVVHQYKVTLLPAQTVPSPLSEQLHVTMPFVEVSQ